MAIFKETEVKTEAGAQESRLKGVLPRKVVPHLHTPSDSITAARENISLATQSFHSQSSTACLCHEIGHNLARHGLENGKRTSPFSARFQRMLENALQA